jgi:transposase
MSVATINKDLSTEKILEAYKQLYKIEQSFRSFKTFLETRPMYHWTRARILGWRDILRVVFRYEIQCCNKFFV